MDNTGLKQGCTPHIYLELSNTLINFGKVINRIIKNNNINNEIDY